MASSWREETEAATRLTTVQSLDLLLWIGSTYNTNKCCTYDRLHKPLLKGVGKRLAFASALSLMLHGYHMTRTSQTVPTEAMKTFCVTHAQVLRRDGFPCHMCMGSRDANLQGLILIFLCLPSDPFSILPILNPLVLKGERTLCSYWDLESIQARKYMSKNRVENNTKTGSWVNKKVEEMLWWAL